VRGVASGDPVVRELVDEARDENAHASSRSSTSWVTPTRPCCRWPRAWVAFAEDVLIELGLESDRPAGEIVAFLSRSALAIAASVDR
jgi:hypothetical protein